MMTLTLLLVALRDHIAASGWTSADADAPTAAADDAVSAQTASTQKLAF